ncbi:FAD-dependent oxidoreductase [Ruegeria sp. 2012CJ41-6]|uniref:FAD-dependent oxidoreductase n=1 Tax=Ruegeria spongiae TaxID=2942209 RepID=A0ABT0Q8H2_9RHOB|nr:FAD-dependent oxidoreductase [Ruegeria spongiae]MCL6286178.1 FAD-dependent oxidoreductase [Ruegeria spongiae]
MAKQDRVLVIGAGVVGLTSAYYLNRAGYKVTVLERADSVATEGSHANAGTLSSFRAQSWASPASLLKFLGGFRRKDSVFRMRLTRDKGFLIWCVIFLRHCLPGATTGINAELKALVIETQEMLKELMGELGGDFSLTQGGLYLVRSQDKIRKLQAQNGLSDSPGYARLLSAEGLLSLEPALEQSQIEFSGGVYVEQDYSADCQAFSSALGDYLRTKMGVKLLFARTVEEIRQTRQEVIVSTRDEDFRTDKAIICAGAATSLLSRNFGFDPKIYPIKGYSVTIPILKRSRVPSLFAVDEAAFVAYSTQGGSFRLASFVENAGFDRSLDDAAVEHLCNYASQVAPGAFDLGAAEAHACLRPMTPGGSPVICKPRPDCNIWINSGHGHKGWGICCATAKRLTALVEQI